MSPADIIIISILLIIVAAIIYFSIWKNRKNPCKGCSYAKRCQGMINCLDEYRKSKIKDAQKDH